MNLLEFIVAWWAASADLVRAIAWPAVVLISVLLLRQPLSKLLPALQSLKAFGAEVTFDAALRQVERAAEAEASTDVEAIGTLAEATRTERTVEAHKEVGEEAQQPTSATDVAVIAESIRGTARKTPVLAVASAASWMNQELRDALEIEDMYEKLPINQLARELRSKGLISDKTADQIAGLVVARNALERSIFEPLTVDGAVRFVDVTERIVTAIREGL